jgi:hypothetical protein
MLQPTWGLRNVPTGSAALVFLSTIALMGFLGVASAQNCALSGTAAWSIQLRNVIAECDNRFTSPDSKLLLQVNPRGEIRVSEVASGNELKVHSPAVEPPAMVSWSPSSDAFFINDGEESGISSTFRLFRVIAGQLVEDGAGEKKAVALYRSKVRCAPEAADPNVWGMGWSPDGTEFHLLIQATVNAPCGETGAFISITMKKVDDSVSEQLSEEATKRKYQALLPREVYSKQ